MIPRYAVIPAHNRPNELEACLNSLKDQCERFIVIDNASNPPLHNNARFIEDNITIIYEPEQPPSLYRFWNIGFDFIEHEVKNEEWDIGVFNDDTIVPSGWWDAVSKYCREHETAVGCSYSYPIRNPPMIMKQPDNNLLLRMCPWAFIVRGELGLRADERFKWWWGDTAWDWMARANGGVSFIPGFLTSNTCANSSTIGELAEQAGRDREMFGQIFGTIPW